MRMALLVLLTMAGCGSREPSPVAVEAAKEERAATSSVTLEEAAQREAGLTFATVTARAVAETVRATGRITIDENRTWRVGAVTDGRVVKVSVNAGDAVQAGQVLARMHSHEVHEGRAAYRHAVAELARLQAQQQHLTRLRDRARRLLALKAASVEQVENAEAELRNGVSAIAQAKVERERTTIHLTDFLGVGLGAEHSDNDGDHDDDLIPVKAPAAGTLLSRNVTQGTVVQPGAEMFVISDLGSVWMVAAVNEDHLARVRVGMGVNVGVQAYPGRHFRGRIVKLGEQLDADTRTLPARIALANQQGLLRPEMYADADLEMPGSRQGLLVPELAIQELKGSPVVFVRKGNAFEAVSVATGDTSGGLIEITHGVEAGMEVVVKGAFLLKSQMLKSSLAEE